MNCEVIIDMRNDNTLCTISMLSAMLENQDGDYYSLLMPFVLCSLPKTLGTEIIVNDVTQAMNNYGFVDFPYRLCETLLERLCRKTDDGHIYVKYKKVDAGKKRFYVNEVCDCSSFDSRRDDMRRKIDAILDAIQAYFEQHFYHKTIDKDSIRDKLTLFFEANGFTVIQSVQDLKRLVRDSDDGSFEIARFILDEYEKKSIVYEDLCTVTKGFLTYKGLYFFLDGRKHQFDSKFKNVTFYLDCSLVLDILNYDTHSDYKAISELVRLIRRCGGNVAVFSHTAQEAGHLIDAFANKPRARNGFRLDNLAVQKLTKELLLAIAKDIPHTLKANAQIDTLDTPSFSDTTNYVNVLGEEEIVDWLTRNRLKRGNSFDLRERYQYDARSLVAIGMCRRGFCPRYIEQARAVLVTQDPWLNRCLRDLYPEKFRSEFLYAITDTELVSLLWLQDYKQSSSLPSDILIANAHAACRVSQEVMDRAIELATKMEESGSIPSDAALLVTSHTAFKPFIAERVQNNSALLSDEEIHSAINDFINACATAKIEEVRTEEKQHADAAMNAQRQLHSNETRVLQSELQAKNEAIARLERQISEQEKREMLEKETARQQKYDRIGKKAQNASNLVRIALQALSVIAAITAIIIFAIHCYQAFVAEQSWLPYVIIEVLSFLSIPTIFLSKKSIFYKWVCRLGDWVYSKVYSSLMNKNG